MIKQMTVTTAKKIITSSSALNVPHAAASRPPAKAEITTKWQCTANLNAQPQSVSFKDVLNHCTALMPA
jgi:hypothetical protein